MKHVRLLVLGVLLAACTDDALLLASRTSHPDVDAGDDATPPGAEAGAPPVVPPPPPSSTDASVTDAGADAPFDAPFDAAPNPPLCNPGGWCWTNPLPQGNTLESLVSAGGGALWAVGTGGTLLRESGGTWSSIATGTNADLLSVWSNGASDAWAVGDLGTILHWDGASWSPIATGVGWRLDAVWSSAPTNVWAGAATAGGLLHFDGTSWTQTVLVRNGTNPGILCLWGTSDTDVWASTTQGMAHWNGLAWTFVDGPATPDPSRTFGGNQPVRMWGSSPNDVWGLGNGAIHWDGTAWTLPALQPMVYQGSALWGIAANDIWAGGMNGALAHWDGATWSSMTVPGNPIVYGIAGASPSDAWLVGAAGLVQHWDGHAWSYPTSSTAPVYGLWGTTDDDVWAITSSGGIRHWDGVRWSDVRAAVYSAGTVGYVPYEGISGTSANDVWAATPQGVLHGNGTSWTISPGSALASGRGLNAIWASAPTDVWAVSYWGETEHFDGTSWTRLVVPATGPLFGVWSSGPSDAYVAANDAVWHWDGASWTSVDVGGLAIWGSAPNDVWVAGGRHLLRHFDGTSWSDVDAGATQTLYNVSGRSANDVWATSRTAAGGAAVVHWDGTKWTSSAVPTANVVDAVWSSGNGAAWLAGENGSILHHAGP